jgi:DNA-binding MarR family transcriptional regulator
MKHVVVDCSGTTRAGLFTLRHAADVVESFIDERLATVGLSVPKLSALDRLQQAGGSLPLGQLAARLACVKSNVTQLVDRLEADGLVERTPDAGDRRSRLAVLTPAGRDAHARGARVLAEAEEQAFARLSDDDRTRLAEIVAKLELPAR